MIDIDIDYMNETNCTSKNSSDEKFLFTDESFYEDNFKFTREITKKETAENVSYACLDININKYNSNTINHSDLKIGEEFLENENVFINEFNDILKKKIVEEKSLLFIFQKIEKFLEYDGNSGNSRNFGNFSNSLKLINKTKKLMLENSYKILVPYIIINLQKDFIKHIKYDNNSKDGRILCLNNIEIQKNINLNYDLNDFSQKKILKIEGKVKEEINNIKSFLYEQNIKGYKVRETLDLVNQYILDHLFSYW